MPRVLLTRVLPTRLLLTRLAAVGAVVALLAACGAPPQPLPTAPPPPSGSVLPSTQPSLPGLPTTAVTPPPAGQLPTYPTLPATALPTTATPTPTGPKPAAKCTSGPTGAQVLAVVKGNPGIPDSQLTVHAGPYCSGSWQFTELELAGKTEDQIEPLLVVTTGKPATLRVVEAGTDVCSDRVQHDAPPGIRVRACGS